ncbi:hypothetical protein KIW84_054009 [Lathyrus oleraceus]|uniref:Major facilitator superfamily (MFS) profile domain-containing protein n=1 Tax=Pisum sativum TaxID=3888 RepID=A0A9D5ADZ8_PEA|nr:hypothetical protein KIW84_054009 [Pisum sativum]
MAGGGFPVENKPVTSIKIGGKLTFSIIISCIVVASSGILFGYDLGVSGGVTTMVPFLQKFFPDILRKAAGGSINGGAANIVMLILGRLLLGLGVGFTNQAAPLYLSEIAPPKWRGTIGTSFQFFLGIGVVAANCINYVTAKHTWGWRLSLGLAVLPAAVMTIGAFLITDTPSSLVERGKIDQARKALSKVRGNSIDIETELEELIKWTEITKSVKQEPFKTILKRKYRPQLVMAFAIPLFQQLSGINVVAFYSPNLFQSVGMGHEGALISAIILGVVNLTSIFISASIVDRFGRRFLFITGGILMFVCLIAVSIVLAVVSGVHGTNGVSKGNAILVLVLLCFYAAGFGWSWGPLTWLIPSEIFPVNIRTTGQSIAIGVQFILTFVLSQTFLTMLCHFKFGAFVFYAFWVVVMTLFIIFFLPETKGISLESMYTIWGKHWFWSRFVKGEDDQENQS